MNLAAMDASSWRLLILVVLALIVGGYLFYLERRGPRERDVLIRRYRTLTEAQLRELPETELLTAVIANLMARQDKRRPEPYYLLPLLSPGQSSVYTVWAACSEWESSGFAALFARRTRPLTEAAVAGFQGVGAQRCAAVLRKALDAPDGENAVRELADEWKKAVEAETPLALCTAYIRENPAEFVGGKA